MIFIAVADTVVDLPGSYFLAVIFFFMVILLGLGSMIGTAEGVVTPVYDAVQTTRYGKYFPKELLVGIISIICFSSGIVLATPGGNYWLDIVDSSTGGIPLLIVGLAQFVVVGWCFRGTYWLDEIKFMLGPPTNIFDSFYR